MEFWPTKCSRWTCYCVLCCTCLVHEQIPGVRGAKTRTLRSKALKIRRKDFAGLHIVYRSPESLQAKSKKKQESTRPAANTTNTTSTNTIPPHCPLQAMVRYCVNLICRTPATYVGRVPCDHRAEATAERTASRLTKKLRYILSAGPKGLLIIIKCNSNCCCTPFRTQSRQGCFPPSPHPQGYIDAPVYSPTAAAAARNTCVLCLKTIRPTLRQGVYLISSSRID